MSACELARRRLLRNKRREPHLDRLDRLNRLPSLENLERFRHGRTSETCVGGEGFCPYTCIASILSAAARFELRKDGRKARKEEKTNRDSSHP